MLKSSSYCSMQVCQINTLYIFNLHNVVCLLYLNKAGKRKHLKSQHCLQNHIISNHLNKLCLQKEKKKKLCASFKPMETPGHPGSRGLWMGEQGASCVRRPWPPLLPHLTPHVLSCGWWPWTSCLLALSFLLHAVLIIIYFRLFSVLSVSHFLLPSMFYVIKPILTFLSFSLVWYI